MTREERRERIRNIGRNVFEKGLPKVGEILIRAGGAAVKRTPVGGVLDEFGVLDAVGEAIGIGDEGSSDEGIETIEEMVTDMSAEQLQALTELKKLETEMAIAEIEADAAIITAQEEADSARVAEINETIRQEVIANPEAGAWRPMWGRWSCRGFWFGLAWVALLAGVDLVGFDGELFIPHLPVILGAFAGVLILPASILGVASYHRGVEKRVLAGEQRKVVTEKKADA